MIPLSVIESLFSDWTESSDEEDEDIEICSAEFYGDEAELAWSLEDFELPLLKESKLSSLELLTLYFSRILLFLLSISKASPM